MKYGMLKLFVSVHSVSVGPQRYRPGAARSGGRHQRPGQRWQDRPHDHNNQRPPGTARGPPEKERKNKRT